MQKNSIFSFTDNLIKELANSEKPDLLPCFNLLHSNEYLSLNFSNEDIEMLSELCNKIILTINELDHDSSISYGNKIYELVEKSKLPLKLKNEIKIANNVTINSNLYWY